MTLLFIVKLIFLSWTLKTLRVPSSETTLSEEMWMTIAKQTMSKELMLRKCFAMKLTRPSLSSFKTREMEQSK